MVVLPKERVFAEVPPRHAREFRVPFETETQSTGMNRPRNHGPSVGFAGDCLHVGKASVYFPVAVPHKIDGRGMRLLGKPVWKVALHCAPVIEHRADRPHPQSIRVIFFQPEDRAAQEKAAHLRPRVLERALVPIRPRAKTRFGLFVKVRSIKQSQAIFVWCEMRRHPGENNTDILLMQALDKIHQILGSAVTTGWREVAGGLITRRVVAWMFHDRQEFGMREA